MNDLYYLFKYKYEQIGLLSINMYKVLVIRYQIYSFYNDTNVI